MCAAWPQAGLLGKRSVKDEGEVGGGEPRRDRLSATGKQRGCCAQAWRPHRMVCLGAWLAEAVGLQEVLRPLRRGARAEGPLSIT